MMFPHPIMTKYYSLVPLPQGIFEKLSLVDRAVFGLIWERWRLSNYKVTGGCLDWYDDDEESIFCIFSHDEMSRQIGVSEKTIRRSLKLLRDDFQMINWKKAGFMGACKYFIDESVQREMAALRQDSKNVQSCP